ncbi:MAG: amidohydrolase [Halanaerobiales bacterium]|nr:amidohydrolase [Halanaerobiales bacterium]
MFFYNGRVLTINSDNSIADFLEIDGERISQVGVCESKRNNGINLQGKSLLPGMIDTHMHLLNYGLVLQAVNLRECDSVEEIAVRVRERVETEERGNWIFGRGWDENRYGGRLPSRDDLDQVSLENPVILSRVCGHLAVLNSDALDRLGINETTSVPEGGVIDRDEKGRLTGVFREKAMDFVFESLPDRSQKEIEEALIRAGKSVLSSGITTIHSDDLDGFSDLEPILGLYRKLMSEGKIPRVHLHIRNHHLKQAREMGLKTGYTKDGVTIGSVKMFADGSLGARTAALVDDYSDLLDEKGILIYSDDQLYQMVKEAHSADFSVAIHGIGDAACSQAVRVIGRVQDEDSKPYLRHKLTHAQILNEEIMQQMVDYNIIGEIQPIFINTDLHWAQSRVGERIQTSYNWQTLWQKGISLSGSSDCPVESVNPLFGIYAATTRKDLQGNPKEGWHLKEALTLEQALQLFTICGAYTGSEEGERGSLEIGKVADLVVLDRPIDQIPLEEIKDVQVVMTIMDGKIVYQNEMR